MRRACTLLALAALSCPAAFTEVPTPASRFVESVGVNIHLHYQDTAYADFPRVEQALRDLGVHHVRDGLIDTTWKPYYAELSALHHDGIDVLLITAPGQGSGVLRDFRRRAPGVGEGIEAPNELDASGNDWSQRLNAELAQIAPVAKEFSWPIVGPSLTKPGSFSETLGPFDVGNLHNYFGGRNPGTPGWGDDAYGSYDWNLRLAHWAFPAKPLITTETGYVMDASMSQGIPQEVAARYTVRLLLEQYMHGIQRTYLYELLDTEIPSRNLRDRFGLVSSDFTRKPAFTAVQSLLKILADSAPITHPRMDHLDLRIVGANADVHHLLFEKQNGEFYLALWVEAPGYDVDAKKFIAVAPKQVRVELPVPWHSEAMHFNDAGTLDVTAPQVNSSLRITVDDRVTILKLSR